MSITPNWEWGGEGILGCDVASGILHRIPTRKQTVNDDEKNEIDLEAIHGTKTEEKLVLPVVISSKGESEKDLVVQPQ